MANFRFNNEQGQDDTGRVATYLQRSIPIIVSDDQTITINPICYVNTYVFEGEQNTNLLFLNIADHNIKSNKGDYLELIFIPTDVLEVYLSFCNVDLQLTALQRFVAYFQYDGTNWVYTNAQNGGGGGGGVGTVTSVNYIAPVSGNVSLGAIVNSVNNVAPVSGNVDLGTLGTVTSVNNIAPINGNVDLTTDGILRLITNFYVQPNLTLFQGVTIINQLPNYTTSNYGTGMYNITFDAPLVNSGQKLLFRINLFNFDNFSTRLAMNEAPPFNFTNFFIYIIDKSGNLVNEFVAFTLEFETYP